MTYYNGDTYAGPTASAPLDEWAHDSCLPADQFTVTMLDDFTTGHTDPVTGYRVYGKTEHRHQVWPWHWAPVYGAAKPCAFCGQPTEHEVSPGAWRPLAPVVAA